MSSIELEEYLKPDIVAIDTESVKKMFRGIWRGETVPWCISLSTSPGTGVVVMADNERLIEIVNRKLEDVRTLTLIHNVMYDKVILDQIGIRPSNFRDTMVMAYLTQSLPQGLKDLAYRLCGMEMSSYEEMVRVPTTLNAERYLSKVADTDWGPVEERLVWVKGEPKIKKGWTLQKRAKRILADYEKDDSTDIRERWEKVDEDMRVKAELELGKMPIGDLSEIDADKAVRYSARDSDATLRIYPKLLEIVEGLNVRRNER